MRTKKKQHQQVRDQRLTLAIEIISIIGAIAQTVGQFIAVFGLVDSL